jgi:hypothetical protein
MARDLVHVLDFGGTEQSLVLVRPSCDWPGLWVGCLAVRRCWVLSLDPTPESGHRRGRRLDQSEGRLPAQEVTSDALDVLRLEGMDPENGQALGFEPGVSPRFELRSTCGSVNLHLMGG